MIHRITPKQYECLDHRMTLMDEDFYAEVYGNWPDKSFTLKAFNEACVIFAAQMEARVLDSSKWSSYCIEIFNELLEGSTYVNATDEDAIRGAQRTMDALWRMYERFNEDIEAKAAVESKGPDYCTACCGEGWRLLPEGQLDCYYCAGTGKVTRD